MANEDKTATFVDGASYFTGVGNEVLVAGIIGIFVLFLAFKAYRTLFPSDVPADGERSTFQNLLTAGRINPGDQECPICISGINFGIETNCGHVFCGNCFMRAAEVAAESTPLSAPPCPYCRQRVTLLMPFFTVAERNLADPEEIRTRDELLIQVKRLNRRYSGGSRSWAEHISDFPMLLRHLYNFLLSPDGLTFYYRIRIFLLMASMMTYILMPLDLVPESFFGIIGYLDDFLVVFFILLILLNSFRNALIELNVI